MDGHWGDIDRANDAGSGIAAIERQQMTKPRPLEIESPFLHRPSGSHSQVAGDHCDTDVTCSAANMNLGICRGILKHRVAVAFARAGFQSCSVECLETFTDVLYHYLQKVFQLLHIAIDSNDMENSFSVIISQVFSELGLDSTTALESYNKFVQ